MSDENTETPPIETPPVDTPPTETPPTETPPVGSLMNDETPPAETPPESVDVDAFLSEAMPEDAIIGKDEAGNELKLTVSDAKLLAPTLAEMGLTGAQGKGVFAAIRAFEGAKMAREIKERNSEVTALAETTKQELGADLPRFVSEAKAGGGALFGADVWAELKQIPAFCNDVRIVKALAAHGRSVQHDHGSASSSDANSRNKKFSFGSWAKSSNSEGR